ncbi:MAG: hypothetical protein A3H96_25105 [Acidobacteria bacterium RIFCSPLOWO2_02_FULL_67_36]|nr:MAG: hypothetical protein A3H96_25105 [Acidobacteria bacterium RIFCSPLOWO2_02_FULL_67_36]OFW20615.1 MAG: hypothetical protein A3G21_22100 [Acidobacteria bacterium RIFCSPLOWO2_12_FULL_66_21]
MVGDTPRLELCVGIYRAQQISGHVVVFADGVHPTNAFQTFLVHESRDPGHFGVALWHLRSEGPSLHVVTPFAVSASLQTTERVEHVRVRDAAGDQLVAVEQVSNAVAAHAR